MLTEHGLDHNALVNTKLDRYTLLADYSRENHRLGGVGIYVRSDTNFNAENINMMEFCTELTCEVALVKVQLGNKFVHILGIYRPPGGQTKMALDSISNILDYITPQNKQLIIIGDVNFDRLSPNIDNALFEELLLSYSIKRLPLPATRITATSKTSIDCICTNIPEHSIEFSIIQKGLSDHTGQICKLNTLPKDKPKNHLTTKRCFNTQNLQSLQATLADENWIEVHGARNAEEAYNAFNLIIRRALDHACPSKKQKLRLRKANVIYDQESKKLKEEFLNAFHTYQTTGSEYHKTIMANKKKMYDLKLRDLKRSTTSQLIASAENKQKALWNIINSEKEQKENSKNSLRIELQSEVVEDPGKIADIFNSFFAEIAEKTLKKTIT